MPLKCFFGFMNGTKVFRRRQRGPNINQRSSYSRHKRIKCLFYLTVTTPDELIVYLHGTYVGRCYDITLYRQSGLDEELQQQSVINGVQFYLYAESTFILRPHLQLALNRSTATAAKQLFNNGMSSLHETFEWIYKDVKHQFTTVEFYRMLKVRKAPFALIYKMSVLLGNCKLCINGGGQVGWYFTCSSMSLESYFAPISYVNYNLAFEKD